MPTLFEEFSEEDVVSIAGRLELMWKVLERKGVDRGLIMQNSFLAPATCNLLNADKTDTVDKSFELLRSVSSYLKERFL